MFFNSGSLRDKYLNYNLTEMSIYMANVQLNPSEISRFFLKIKKRFYRSSHNRHSWIYTTHEGTISAVGYNSRCLSTSEDADLLRIT